MATKAPELTKEELATAQDELARERAVANRAEADRQAEALREKNERQANLTDARTKAGAVLENREALLSELVATLERVKQLVGKLRTGKAIFDAQVTRAAKNDGTLTVSYPRFFGVDSKERQLIRDTIEAVQSIGGSV